MPYVSYKGALLSVDEYEKFKDKLEKEEMEYLKLLLGHNKEEEHDKLEEEHKEEKKEENEDKEKGEEPQTEELQDESSEGSKEEPKEAESGEDGPTKDKEVSEEAQESYNKTSRRRRSR